MTTKSWEHFLLKTWCSSFWFNVYTCLYYCLYTFILHVYTRVESLLLLLSSSQTKRSVLLNDTNVYRTGPHDAGATVDGFHDPASLDVDVDTVEAFRIINIYDEHCHNHMNIYIYNIYNYIQHQILMIYNVLIYIDIKYYSTTTLTTVGHTLTISLPGFTHGCDCIKGHPFWCRTTNTRNLVLFGCQPYGVTPWRCQGVAIQFSSKARCHKTDQNCKSIQPGRNSRAISGHFPEWFDVNSPYSAEHQRILQAAAFWPTCACF